MLEVQLKDGRFQVNNEWMSTILNDQSYNQNAAHPKSGATSSAATPAPSPAPTPAATPAPIPVPSPSLARNATGLPQQQTQVQQQQKQQQQQQPQQTKMPQVVASNKQNPNKKTLYTTTSQASQPFSYNIRFQFIIEQITFKFVNDYSKAT